MSRRWNKFSTSTCVLIITQWPSYHMGPIGLTPDTLLSPTLCLLLRHVTWVQTTDCSITLHYRLQHHFAVDDILRSQYQQDLPSWYIRRDRRGATSENFSFCESSREDLIPWHPLTCCLQSFFSASPPPPVELRTEVTSSTNTSWTTVTPSMSEIPLFIWCLSGKAEEKMKTKNPPH